MELESVQGAAAPRPTDATASGFTGIDKVPVHRAFVAVDGVRGDTIANPDVHGGPDQAVYLYARDDYEAWEAELGRPLTPGTFGENLTVTTMGEAPVRVGDRYRVGPVLLEVTAPRTPCRTFQQKMGEPDWVRRFQAFGRLGYYCRVLEEGEVADGDVVERIPAPASNATIDDLADVVHDRGASAERIRALLASPVAVRFREYLEQRLARLDTS